MASVKATTRLSRALTLNPSTRPPWPRSSRIHGRETFWPFTSGPRKKVARLARQLRPPSSLRYAVSW